MLKTTRTKTLISLRGTTEAQNPLDVQTTWLNQTIVTSLYIFAKITITLPMKRFAIKICENPHSNRSEVQLAM